jgi:hypothetical protein
MGFTPKKTEKNMEKLMLSTSRPVYSKSGSFKCLSWVEYFAPLSHFRPVNVFTSFLETAKVMSPQHPIKAIS